MTKLDPKNRSANLAMTAGPEEGPVKVIARDSPAHAPRRHAPRREEPAPRRRLPDAIVIPENQPSEEREAYIASLDQQWGGLITKELARRRDVSPASVEDLHQSVLISLDKYFEQQRSEGNPCDPKKVQPALIRTFVEHVAMNHDRMKKRRPKVDGDAEVDATPASGPDPEGAAIRAEQREKLARYRAELTPEEAEILEAREIDEMTFAVIAAALGRPLNKVYQIHRGAMEKLRELAQASERRPKRR